MTSAPRVRALSIHADYRSLLKEAVRRADLLLLRLADPHALARRLSRGEAAGEPPAAW